MIPRALGPGGANRPRPHGLARRLLTILLAATALAGCGVDVQGEDPPLDRLNYPVGMAVHPTGRYLYVVNSNFDVEFRQDRGGTVTVIDTDALDIIPGSTVQIGTFGGDIELNSPPDGSPTQAYVAVRGNQSVTRLDIGANGAVLRCNGQRLTDGCLMTTENDDPFGLAVATDTITRTVGEGANAREVTFLRDFVAVAHLVGGNVTGFSVLDPLGEEAGPSGAANVTRTTAPIVAGANAIARNPRTGQYYVTSRFNNTVVAFRPVFELDSGVLDAIFQVDEVTIENAAPFNGLDSRGIAFNDSGTMAYVANRGPNSLLFIDVGPTDLDTQTGVRNQVIDLLPLPASPSDVKVLDFDGEELIYVSSYAEQVITLVDPVSHEVVGTIDIGGQPYEMAVDQVRHQRMYVSLFNTHAVAVIDIDPSSPSFNQVVGVVR